MKPNRIDEQSPLTVQDGAHSFNGRAATVPQSQPKNGAIVCVRGLQVKYGDAAPPVLNIEELSFREGERVALIGPSGAGKTTLLRLLNGYVRPKEGAVTVLGTQLKPSGAERGRNLWPRSLRRQIGFVFQDFSLVERATVFQNVLWGRLGWVNPLASVMGVFSRADKVAAMEAIAEVDLLPQARQRVDTLSGGQQQRVGVARVVAQQACVILADEPVSNLDPALADDVLTLLSEVSRRRHATLIMSLHQPPLARRYADRIIGLRAGRVVFDGRAELLDDAALQALYGREAPAEASSDPHPRPTDPQTALPSFA